jgi:hypothetical protein
MMSQPVQALGVRRYDMNIIGFSLGVLHAEGGGVANNRPLQPLYAREVLR